jgi:hypothetical protein
MQESGSSRGLGSSYQGLGIRPGGFGICRFQAPSRSQELRSLWIDFAICRGTAHASGAELETQLEIGARVEIIPLDQADVLIRDAQEVGRMLNGLIKSLDPTS